MSTRDSKLRKVTMYLPEELVDQAVHVTRKNLTETVRQGLRLVATGSTFDQLLKYRGKVKLSLDIDKLREDR